MKLAYRILSIASCTALACSSAQQSEDGQLARAHGDPIINGSSLSNDEALVSPSVRIVACEKQPPNTCFEGAGVLIRHPTIPTRSVVLTAQHVVQYGTGTRPIDPTSIRVTHGNASDPRSKTSDIIGSPKYFIPIVHPKSRSDDEIDFALLELKDTIHEPQTTLPELECAMNEERVPVRYPSFVACTSSMRHTLGANDAILSTSGLVNTAAFETSSNFRYASYTVVYEPNPTQATAGGDSGMGCLDFDTDRLAVIHNSGVRTLFQDLFLGPLSKRSTGQLVAFFCDWINETLNPGTKVVYEDHVGDGDALPDRVAIRQLSGTDHTLAINRTRLGAQTFPVTLPDGQQFLSAAIGSFTGGRAALAVSVDGTLMTTSFNGGPTPAIIDAPSTDYVALTRGHISSDGTDDLVAQRSTGEIDVFVGSSAGLTFNPALTPIPMRLDRDAVPDFVYVSGTSVHAFSTILDTEQEGKTARDTTLPLIDVLNGRFRDYRVEFPTAPAGSQGLNDVVVLSTEASGGAVIWCPTTGFGLRCTPALDWERNTGRTANKIEVGEANGDEFDDIKVSYADPDTSPRFFLGSPSGFLPNFGNPTRHPAAGDVNGDGENDTVTVDEEPETPVGPPSGNIAVRVSIPGLGLFGPFTLPIPFVEPIKVAFGNFNGDLVAASLALSGDTTGTLATPPSNPVQDLAILSGDRVFVLISNGDGTFELNALDDATGFTAIAVNDANGDGFDDIEATAFDGSVTVFSGSDTGLGAEGVNFSGLPTAESEDGKMLVVSGLGVDTVGATEARLRITVGEDDVDSHDELVVQVFDGNNGGLHQFEEQTHALKTCFRLNADPCGDGNIGTCSGGPTTPVELITVSSDDLGEDVWDTIFQGAHPASASLLRDGEPPYSYELRVYLSEDCATLPAVGATIPVATADAFKVRANAMVSHPAGEFSFVGSDSDGDFGVPDQAYMRNTDFDGTFELPIAVGSSASEVQLMEADADDTDDSSAPGVSLGATADIQYRLVRPNGTDAPLVGAEDSSPASVVTNPSGNNDGFTDFDVETRIHTITTPAPGTWIWRWEGVTASNAVHVFAPFGSPTTFEVLGARRRRSSLTTAQLPSFWDSNDAALQARLPITLGGSSGGSALGATTTVRTLADARQVIANADQSLSGELRRQLLIARLNQGRGAELGEDLRGGLVYGTTTSVRTVLERADRAVTGVDLELGDEESRRLVQLLSAVNLGEINYRLPGVPFPARPMLDDDDDGVMNLKDNCPPVANPLQEDGDDDRVGDACAVVPVVQCVRRTSETSYRAHFGYDNPLSYRSIALGTRNSVLDETDRSLQPLADFGQPSEFAFGLQTNVWTSDFSSGASVQWTLDDHIARATADGPACSGRELTVVPFPGKVAVFGTESVIIGEHSAVVGQDALAAAFSEGDVVVGADTVVDNVMSGGRLTLGERSVVIGSAVTRLGVERRPGAAVSGRIVTSQGVPNHSLAWLVEFRSGAEVDVLPEEIRRLAPGEYGSVTVGPSAQLVLEGGWYRFESLEVDDSATVLVSDEVVLHVNEAFAHHGETRLVGNDASVVIAFFGESPAVIDSSFQGVFVASNASLTLGSAYNSIYRGSFFARSVEILPGTLVEFAPR